MTSSMPERLKNNIEYGIGLAPFTTMGIGGPAAHFVRVTREEDIPEIIDWAQQKGIPLLVFGGGSNVVVSDRGFSGLALKMEISGIHCTHETSFQVELECAAGESWDRFVEYTVQKGWWGVENMSFIPGTVGAVAVQNVSAYGQESKTVITKVRAYDIYTAGFVELRNDQCEFGFRKSIFNTTEAGRYIIVAVGFQLYKKGRPNLSRREIAYDIEKWRQTRIKRVTGYEQAEIRAAVIRLRTSGKLLPPPDTVGNSGTFFRASVISHNNLWKTLKNVYRNIGLTLVVKILGCRWRYSSKKGFKVPSRMLIEACGLEKLHYGSISLYKTNCAVLINSGGASGAADILRMIRQVRVAVYSKTGVIVPVEPSLVGFAEDELKQAFCLSSDENKGASCT